MKKVAVLLTCYNRKEYTVRAISKLNSGNPGLDLRFVVTDDASDDGTAEALEQLGVKLHLIRGNGHFFWGGGMRSSIDYALKSAEKIDYALFINDDVDFFDGAVQQMVKRLEDNSADAVVGATVDDKGEISYGGVRKDSKFFVRLSHIKPSKEPIVCDTFNCNAVLIKADVFSEMGNLDSVYKHSMGDYDYGMGMRKRGYTIINTSDYIGKCNGNPIENTWLDSKLPKKERLRKKESTKGLPRGDWFHFVCKNYNFFAAVYHSMTPYVKILFGK